MAQHIRQEQELIQQQLQRMTAQQLLTVHLLEMPLAQLEQAVNTELNDNPALESGTPEDVIGQEMSGNVLQEESGNESFEQQTEREERAEQLDAALDSIDIDDRLPDYRTRNHATQEADEEEIVYGDMVSFYDKLKQQMGELVLSEQQREIMEYLIGSLDDDGLLRKDLGYISDELAIYHNIDVSKEEIAKVLDLLHDFDPPGIGAQSLQECLLLQLHRRPDTPQKHLTQRIIERYFDEFTKKHWHKIKAALHLDEEQMEAVKAEIRRLNPKPGASLGETEGRNIQQITPDFIVDTAEDGSVSFTLNRGNLPELYVSQTFADLVSTYRDNKEGMSRQDKEALLYAKGKISKAQGFIEAVKQRRQTMAKTMEAIIRLQKPFFQEGDESELRPMVLKDIANLSGLDISTVSRVVGIKYAQTRWGIFPLRYFFGDSFTTEEGEEMSIRKIKAALKEVIEGEDKQSPMTDEALTKEMQQRGFPIARRTTSKYREQMGIPVARLRRQ